MKALQALKPLSQIKKFGKTVDVAPTEVSEKVAPVAKKVEAEKKPAAPKKAPAKKSAE